VERRATHHSAAAPVARPATGKAIGHLPRNARQKREEVVGGVRLPARSLH
jgi:hypothetical protein